VHKPIIAHVTCGHHSLLTVHADTTMSHGKSKVLTDAEILGLDLAGSHREGHHGPELLTDEQILQFKRVFDYHDRDHTGTIAEDELSSIMSSLGQNCTNAEVMDLINVIDLDGNGKIDFPDFLTMILTFSLSFGDADDEDIFEEIKYAFNTFDSDGSGDISIRDLRLIAETMAGDRVDPEVIDELIMEADVDGDGQVRGAV
jgi:calmodulin